MLRTIQHITILLAISSVCAAATTLIRPIHAPVRLETSPPLVLAKIQSSLHVSLKQVRQWDEPVLWIDARGSFELYEQDHIPGALYLVEEGWDHLLPYVTAAYQPTMRVVVYCDGSGCLASDRVAMRLRNQLGWEHVSVLGGGWDAWQAGHP
jgi:3-mercaptopyruvate sulfurtransferase SseA